MTRDSGSARVIAAGLLVLVMALAARDVATEAGIDRSARMLATQADRPPAAPLRGPPRRQLVDGLRLARHAVLLPPGAMRDRTLAAATTAVDAAAAARPLWGEALAGSAYVHTLVSGPRAQRDAARILSSSYAAAPFLVRAGPWRISYAAAHWESLSPITQRDVLAEAVWLSGAAPSLSEGILAAFRSSAGYRPLMARWRRGPMPEEPEVQRP